MKKLNILPWDFINKYIILEELEPVGKFRRFKHQCSKCWNIQETFYSWMKTLKCCDSYWSKISWRTEKKCPKCNIIKDINDFYNSKKAKDLHSAYCIECTSKIIIIYDPVKNLERSMRRLEKKREYMREYAKSYHKRDYVKAKKQDIQKRKYKLNKWLYKYDLLDILNKQDWKCNYCWWEATVKDHILPISKWWLSTLDNIQRLCHICNCKKHTKTHEEFLNYLELEKQYL